ncbi:hypothetical protein GSI_06636 [Ganoderma sinense ZZ0214-1]|uniref:Uncharacterized protein n=1 Tax=Ganoderma sinense ZZ0214-1 TaxID=1077348 RepID=A0A2G8SDV1_9APHY|nr:hypothetical protein GSI_06636 [Ganoderma sinense ZZ0214-1]
MSLPKPTSINGACLPPSMNKATQDVLPLEVSTAVLPQGHLLAPWQGEASPVSTSPACSTPRELEEPPEDLGLLVVADGDEDIDFLCTSIKQDSDGKQPGKFARVEVPNGFFGFQPDEDDGDDDEDEYQPKGSFNPPTKPQPSTIRTTTSVGKPAGK